MQSSDTYTSKTGQILQIEKRTNIRNIIKSHFREIYRHNIRTRALSRALRRERKFARTNIYTYTYKHIHIHTNNVNIFLSPWGTVGTRERDDTDMPHTRLPRALCPRWMLAH